MKKLILITIVFIYLNFLGFSQEFNSTQKDSSKHVFVSVGVVMSHFIPTDDATGLNWKTQVLSPGGEVLMGYGFNNKLYLMTGLNYQLGKISLSHFYYGDRTFLHEISVPVLFGYTFFNNGRSKYSLKAGVNLLKFSHVKRETKGGKLVSDTDKWVELDNDNYLNFASDLYLGLNYHPPIPRVPISFEIFSQYRMNDYWLNEYLSRFNFGIKINWPLGGRKG
jgi:hypothetical protein